MKEPISFVDIYSALEKIQTKTRTLPTALKMPQTTFNDLYDLAMENYAVEEVEIDKTKDRPFDKNTTVFGVRIELDNNMKDGTWRFEQ